MTETATSPDLQSQEQETPAADPRAGLTHVQRTDPDRLYGEYRQYFVDERVAEEKASTGWQRLKSTWYNFFAGVDATESNYFFVMLEVGFMSGLAYGAIYKTSQTIAQYHKQHDDFVAAGLLREKDQLNSTAWFRLVKNGIRSSVVCSVTPMALMMGMMSSLSYRNDVCWYDFGSLFAITNVLFNIQRERSLILRHGAIAFAAGTGVAGALKAFMWYTGFSASEWRYWAITRRSRMNEMMSRKSWEAYRDKPQFKHLYERELDLAESWKRHKEQIALLKEKRESGEMPFAVKRNPRYKVVIDGEPTDNKN